MFLRSFYFDLTHGVWVIISLMSVTHKGYYDFGPEVSVADEDASAAAAESLQSCPTLCDPLDGSPLGSSVPGILQARILESVAISFSS